MKFDEKIVEHLRAENSFRKKERVIGRYNASELYGIIKGWTSAPAWFKGEEADADGIWRMFVGSAFDGVAKSALRKEGYDCEGKRELLIAPGIVIVCMPDAIKNDTIFEFKTLTTNMQGIPKRVADVEGPLPSHIPQLEVYLRAWDYRKGYISYLQVLPRDSRTFEYIRNDAFFEELKTKVLKFHEKILKYKAHLSKREETNKLL